MNSKQQQFGIGLESEGFIVDQNGNGQAQIENQPSSEWIVKKAQSLAPKIQNNLSFEQASVMLEVKSDVFPSEHLAIEQIQDIRQQINQLLADQGLKLVFKPVLDKPFDFLPATSSPNSRTHQLIKEWSEFPNGQKMLDSTATCSFQINDSRPFSQAKTDADRLEIGRQAHNLFSSNFRQLIDQNDPEQTDSKGMNRLDRAAFLLTTVKAPQFLQHGFRNPQQIIVPPFFADLMAMQRWMQAHSDVSDFTQAECKNEHAITVKIKRNPWIIETRIFDAVDSAKSMDKLVDINNSLLGQLRLNF